MPNRIRLTVVTGPHRQQSFVIENQARCLVGRGEDCQVRLSGTDRDLAISRHHCLLDLDASHALVSDLGSRNGTFVNGKKIEKCRDCAAGDKPATGCAGAVLRDGDVLTIGGSSFWVAVQ